jgi:predicted membrane-bound mannosyltransferase
MTDRRMDLLRPMQQVATWAWLNRHLSSRLQLHAIPALVFYPVVHTMMGAFATLAVLCYCLLATAVGVGRRFLHHREASTREISKRAGINRTSASTGRSFAGSL